MKKFFSLILALLLVSALSVPALAANDLTVTYSARGALTDNYEASDFLQPVADLQPGDSVTLTVHLVNANEQGSNWYMANDILESLETSVATGSAYGYELTYSGPGGSRTIYSSSTVGGDDSEGLREATEGLNQLFYLDTLASGDSAEVSLKVTLDGETEGNAYFDTLARLQLNFAVEPVAEAEEETPAPPVPQNPVQTGDAAHTFPLYVGMAASGAVILLLAFATLKRRRNDRREDV